MQYGIENGIQAELRSFSRLSGGRGIAAQLYAGPRLDLAARYRLGEAGARLKPRFQRFY